PVDGATTAQWGHRLAVRFAAELDAKPAYYRFRVIAADGREIVSVDRFGPGGAIHIVPDDELQARGDRDFFRRALRLTTSEIDVSAIELSRDAAETKPDVPVFRVATPFLAPDGTVFGIIIINVDL